MVETLERTLWIEVAPAEDWPEHTQERLRKILSGEEEARVTYSFPSVESLLEMLTPARWTLLQGLVDTPPMSLRALARRVGRDVKGVHADVHRLLRIGLLEKTQHGQLRLSGNHDAEPQHGIPAVRITEIHVDFTVRGNETKEAA